LTDLLAGTAKDPSPGTSNGSLAGSSTGPSTGDGTAGRAAARRSFDLAQRLRSLTGVDEGLLGRVPYERSKYTALGGVVLGTSVIAAFSMWNFATEVLGRVSALALIPTVIWMLFVLNLDRWLVTPQPNARRRVGPLLMRLLVALMLGAVIAEPLVLRIFETAVEERITDERNGDVDRLETNLVRCNPVPSTTEATTPAGCANKYVLSFGATPGGQAEQLTELRSDAAALQKRVDRNTARLESIDSQVRDECRQLIRNAVTGLYQRTSECIRLREKAQDYRATHRTDEEEARLAKLNNRIAKMGGGLTSSRADFLEARAKAIEERLDEERAKQKEIGVLERIRALDDLGSDNTVLFVGIWLVRLLFVLLDALPVLVKFLSGETAYDRMLTSESNSAVKIHSEEIRLAERRAMANIEIAQDAIEQEVRLHRAESDATFREHAAAMNIRVRQAVNALEEEIRRTSTV
jgi:hypothetical protein